jgi:trehalose 6-phosphate phosphatase
LSVGQPDAIVQEIASHVPGEILGESNAARLYRFGNVRARTGMRGLLVGWMYTRIDSSPRIDPSRSGLMTRRPSRGFAYFLDIDGTLVEFARDPARIKLDPAVPLLLDMLWRSSGGAVALITGRPLDDVDRLFPGQQLPAAGHHGLERRAADGHIERHAAHPHALDGARRVLAEVVRTHPQLLLEDKHISLALHYRRAPRLGPFANRVMRQLQQALGSRYCLQRGKRVIELAPAGRDKGAAITAFMREPPFRGRTPFFIGDDVTDEYGFAVVNRLGGWAVKVGRGGSVANWRLSSVRSVLSWLEHGRPEPVRATRKKRTLP